MVCYEDAKERITQIYQILKLFRHGVAVLPASTYRDLLKENEHRILIVHYSCSSIRKFPCRISCIGIRDEYHNQTLLFSLKASCEEKILENFWRVVGENRENYFVGWNIKNPEFGFSVLKERYEKVAKKKAPNIKKSHIIDLDESIKRDYDLKRQRLRLKEIADINGYQTLNFRSGKEELRMFEEEDFKGLELSVGRKLKIIGDILNDFVRNRLQTKPRTMNGIEMGPSRQVKILFLAASPKDQDRIRLDEEYREIEHQILLAQKKEQLIVVKKGAVRIGDLQLYLNQERPTIVHFSGHGTDEGIVLEDNSGNAKTVPPVALARVFEVLKDNIRCVLLNACFSREQAYAISQHIDCVVGMSSSISDEAAISFASAFYLAIACERSLKEAFDQGINELLLLHIPHEHTPRLLTRARAIFLLESKPLVAETIEHKSHEEQESIDPRFVHLTIHYSQRTDTPDTLNPARPRYVVNNKTKQAYWIPTWLESFIKQHKISWNTHDGETALKTYFQKVKIEVHNENPLPEDLDLDIAVIFDVKK